MSGPSSERLAEAVSAQRPETIPAAARERAVALLAGALAAGAAAPPPPPLAAVLNSLGSPPRCSIWSSGEATGATYAAYLNAAALLGSGAPFDARLAAAIVAPACVAAAELAEVPGSDLLCGVAVGIEVALQLAEALGTRHEERGFSLLGSAGRVGAALGAARTLSLSPAAVLATTGFAATQAAGPLRGAGTAARALLGGKAAADALEAALYCRAGLIGPREPLEGRRGLFALELAGDASAIDGALGERWLLSAAAAADAPAPVAAAAAELLVGGSLATLLARAQG